MKQALHIKNLTKKYKDFTLDHISLDLPYGMILGLIGENGSGKSRKKSKKRLPSSLTTLITVRI